MSEAAPKDWRGRFFEDFEDNVWFTCLTIWTDIKLRGPVFVGDTLWAQSEELRESESRPQMGVVTLRSRGINQDGDVVVESRRVFLCYKRDAPEAQNGRAPAVDEPWTVS